MPARKFNEERFIEVYQSLVLAEARRRMGHGFPPFVAFLDPAPGHVLLDMREVDFHDCESCKDEFVGWIKQQAQQQKSIAVWAATRGFVAPPGRRPSRHPQRRWVFLVFESTKRGDWYWQALAGKVDARGNCRAGRWYGTRAEGRRFTGLIGEGARLSLVDGGKRG